MCGICKPLQPPATHELSLVKRRGERFESARRLFVFGLPKAILRKEFAAVSTTQPRRWRRQGTINLAEDDKIRAVKTGVGWLYDPDSVEMIKARLKASKGG